MFGEGRIPSLQALGQQVGLAASETLAQSPVDATDGAEGISGYPLFVVD